MKLTCTKPLKHSRQGDSRDWRHPVHGTTCTCHHCTCVCSLAGYVSPNSVDNTFLTYTRKYNTKYNTHAHTQIRAHARAHGPTQYTCVQVVCSLLNAGAHVTILNRGEPIDQTTRSALCILLCSQRMHSLSRYLSGARSLSPSLSRSFAPSRPSLHFLFLDLLSASLPSYFLPFFLRNPLFLLTTAIPFNTCNALQHCNTLQYSNRLTDVWQPNHQKHCNTLPRTATHCNTS